LGLLETYHLKWWSRQVERRPILTDWNREHCAIFVHIPKTAGTTVLELIGADHVFDTHAPALTYRDADPEFFNRAFKFAFIRNPWDRFASAFHFMKNGTDWPMQQEWSKRHIAELDFAAFVRKLRNPLFRQVVLSERFFWPQAFWVTDRRGELLVDELYRFEDLNSALPSLTRRIGMEPSRSIPERRKSHRGTARALYLDSEMVDLVARLYADDIARFDYRFPG
jgi:chondroitin 4-sulfotransferase 11